MGFSRLEYWSELPFPSPGDLPDPGIEPGITALQADSLFSEPPGKLGGCIDKDSVILTNIYGALLQEPGSRNDQRQNHSQFFL